VAATAANAATSADNKPGSNDGFAKMLAKSKSDDTTSTAKPAGKTDDTNKDNVVMLAAPVAATPPVQPNAAPTPPAKPSADALRAIDMAQLRAGLDQASPTPPVKPGTPTLPVMPTTGDEDGDAEPADAAAALSPKDIAAKLASASAPLHMEKPATTAQGADAPTLPTGPDGKDSQNGGANMGGQGSPNDQNGQNHAAPNTAAPATTANQLAATAVHAPTAPVAQPANATPPAASNAATAAVSGIASAPPSVASTLHIAQAAQSDAPASPQPNIAALAVTIAANAQAGTKHFDIRMDPPELGRIEVHLSVDDAGKAQAHLSADKPQTLELLQRDSTTLQRGLKDAGVDVGSNGLQFSLRGQERQGGDGDRSPRGRALGVTAIADTKAPSPNSYAPDSARLDIRV
jgi:flagellar hook-length control protein FliK